MIYSADTFDESFDASGTCPRSSISVAPGCRCPVCHSRSTIPYESHSTQAWDNFVLCQPVYAVNWRLGKQLDELKPRRGKTELAFGKILGVPSTKRSCLSLHIGCGAVISAALAYYDQEQLYVHRCDGAVVKTAAV